MKAVDRIVKKVGSMNCNFSVTFNKSLNQSSTKPCLKLFCSSGVHSKPLLTTVHIKIQTYQVTLTVFNLG